MLKNRVLGTTHGCTDAAGLHEIRFCISCRYPAGSDAQSMRNTAEEVVLFQLVWFPVFLL